MKRFLAISLVVLLIVSQMPVWNLNTINRVWAADSGETVTDIVYDVTSVKYPRNGASAFNIDGKVYLALGETDEDYEEDELPPVEIYDPDSDTWTVGADMPDELNGAKGVLVPATDDSVTDRIYGTGKKGDIYYYNPDDDQWISTGVKAPFEQGKKKNFAMTYLDGKIYIISGKNDDDSLSHEVLVYDVIENQILAPAANIPVARKNFGATVFDGKIYVFGGELDGDKSSDRVDVYDPDTDTWTLWDTMPLPWDQATPVVFDDAIYLLGGVGPGEFYPYVYRYEPENKNWIRKTNLPEPRTEASVVAAPGLNGEEGIYIISGYTFDKDEFDKSYNAQVRLYYPERDPGFNQEDLMVDDPDIEGPVNIHLTWQHDPATSITLNWRVDPTVTSSQVRVYNGEDLLAEKDGIAESYENMGRMIKNYNAEVTGLEPNTTYRYEIEAEGQMEEGNFTTAQSGEQSFSFLAVADTQNKYDLFTGLIGGLQDSGINPDFLFHVGDLTDIGTHEEYDGLWDSFGTWGREKVLMPVMGNHEKEAVTYFGQFALPDDNDERWYSFDYGNAHFTVLYTGTEEQIEAQTQWLEQDLAANQDKTWEIVMFHKPVYTSGEDHQSELTAQEKWVPIFDQYGVDLVISAHNGTYERSKPLRGGQGQDDGYEPENGRVDPNGTVYVVNSGSGDDMQDFNEDLEGLDWWTEFKSNELHPALSVNINGNQLEAQAWGYDEDSEQLTLMDTFTLTKEPFAITGGQLDRTSGIKATVNVNRTGATDHEGEEVVIFQLMAGKTPVSIVALQKDIQQTEKLISHFNKTGDEFWVKTFVFDKFNSDPGSVQNNLAEAQVLE